jgi:hypothetical protein
MRAGMRLFRSIGKRCNRQTVLKSSSGTRRIIGYFILLIQWPNGTARA